MLLVALCTAFAASLALVTDLPWNILVLGAAPGSITEMALTARFLREDVALITAFHLVRIFLIIPSTPFMLALLHARLAPSNSDPARQDEPRSEEHTSELQSLMRISYAVFCLKKKKINTNLIKPLPHSLNTTQSDRNTNISHPICTTH